MYVRTLPSSQSQSQSHAHARTNRWYQPTNQPTDRPTSRHTNHPRPRRPLPCLRRELSWEDRTPTQTGRQAGRQAGPIPFTPTHEWMCVRKSTTICGWWVVQARASARCQSNPRLLEGTRASSYLHPHRLSLTVGTHRLLVPLGHGRRTDFHLVGAPPSTYKHGAETTYIHVYIHNSSNTHVSGRVEVCVCARACRDPRGAGQIPRTCAHAHARTPSTIDGTLQAQ